jgi:oligopeptide transport system ATP-binding protein
VEKQSAAAGKLLEVEDLQVSFFTPVGEVKAVGGISYGLNYGEVMGIVGESGSGKSVEAFALMGIIDHPGRVVGGSVKLEGQHIQGLTPKELEDIRGKQISMIFQNPMDSLNPLYTVENQMVSVLRKHKPEMKRQQAAEKALDLLRLVGITNPERRLKQYPYELSGGMNQRVMIALSLICDPKILIADEPTTALDVTIQAQILELMKAVKERTGMAIIFITHNLAVIAEICDKVAVMYGGHIVERGTVDEIFYEANHPYTKGLLRSMPRIDEEEAERLIPIEGTPINMLNPNPGCPFAPRCEHCMRICVKQMPGLAPLSESHFSSCWLLHREGNANE